MAAYWLTKKLLKKTHCKVKSSHSTQDSSKEASEDSKQILIQLSQNS